MQNEAELISAKELALMLGVKNSTAYKIIRVANAKLSQAGKIAVRGKVNRKYISKLLDVTDIG